MLKIVRVVPLVLFILLFSGLGQADNSSAILKAISECFHPFSDYVDGQIGSPYQVSEHTRAMDGHVRYRQLDNHVKRMPFQLQVRDVDGERMWRVVPDDENDSGQFGPSTTCNMRQWHSGSGN